MNSQYLQIDNIHIFIWIILMYLFSKGVQTDREEIVLEKKVIRATPFFAILCFLPVLLMTVYGRPRSDTYLYLSSFHALPTDMEGIRNTISRSDCPGFSIFCILVKLLFGNNDSAYRMMIALIHTIPVLYVFRKYSDNYLFTIYLFIAIGNHMAWMMNGLRQYMAVTMIFGATPWLIQKKYIRTILVILIAATIHRTALFMLPVIFLVQGEVWNKKTILYIVGAVAAAGVFARNSAAFDNFADSVGYSLEAAREFGDDGANPLRVLVSAVPIVIAYLGRNVLRDEKNPIIDICVNMSIITTGIYLVAMVTSGIMVGRMPIYTSLYSLILLPHVIPAFFDETSSKVVSAAAVIFYFLHFYLQWGI